MLFVTSQHPRQQIPMINVKQNIFNVKKNRHFHCQEESCRIFLNIFSDTYCDKSLIRNNSYMCRGQCLCPGPCPMKIVSVNSIFQQKPSTPIRGGGGGGGGNPTLNIRDDS